MMNDGKHNTPAAKIVEEHGSIIVSFSTGHSIVIPLHAMISTPFIAASAPRMIFGTVHVSKSTDGILLLSNPTDVPARWTVSHVPGAGGSRKISTIRVKGFIEQSPQQDDPDVFSITPNAGLVTGPTVSATAATYNPPVDLNRR